MPKGGAGRGQGRHAKPEGEKKKAFTRALAPAAIEQLKKIATHADVSDAAALEGVIREGYELRFGKSS